MSNMLSLISLTPLTREAGSKKIDNLLFSIEKLNEFKGLVRISANWSLVLTNQTSRTINIQDSIDNIVPHKMNVDLNMFGA